MKTVKSLLESIIDDCSVPMGNTAPIKSAAEQALALLKVHVTEDGNGIFIPLIGRVISLEAMRELGAREMNWNEAMEWCKERGLEMLGLEDSQIAFAQIKDINKILEDNGIPKVKLAWSGTQITPSTAWRWFSGSWNDASKGNLYRVVPVKENIKEIKTKK